jgi:hypothetical protein
MRNMRRHRNHDEEIFRDGEGTRVPMYLMDQATLDAHRPGYRTSSHAKTDAPKSPDPTEAATAAAYQAYKTALGQAWRIGNNMTPFQSPAGDLLLATRLARMLGLHSPLSSSSVPLIDPRAMALAGLREVPATPTPSTRAPIDPSPKPVAFVGDRDAAREEMIDRLRNAWRPLRDQEPDENGNGDDPDSEDPNDPAEQNEQQLENWRGMDLASLRRDAERQRAKRDSAQRASLSNAWRTAGSR